MARISSGERFGGETCLNPADLSPASGLNNPGGRFQREPPSNDYRGVHQQQQGTWKPAWERTDHAPRVRPAPGFSCERIPTIFHPPPISLTLRLLCTPPPSSLCLSR